MSKPIVRYTVDLSNPPPLTAEQKAELKALADMPDREIDFSDIPELDETFWKNAVRNPFLAGRPKKRPPEEGHEFFGEGAIQLDTCSTYSLCLRHAYHKIMVSMEKLWRW